MTNLTLINSPCRIMIGSGSINCIADEIAILGGTKPLIVTDPVIKKIGLLSIVISSLESRAINYVIFDEVISDPTVSCIEKCLNAFKKGNCDFVVGLGGGSSIDVAKAVSVLANNEESILDLCGYSLVKNRGVTKILIPTTAGTGSEVSNVLVVNDEKNKIKKGVTSPFVLPDLAIIDSELTLTVPPKVTADTGIDALAHAIEAYISTESNPFSDAFAELAIKRIATFLPQAYVKGKNREAREAMSIAATMAGLAFGSAKVGAAHALAYPIGSVYHLSHGRAVGIILPHVMGYCLYGDLEKFASLATLMGQETSGMDRRRAAEMSVQAVKDLLASVDISYHMSDYGYTQEHLPNLVIEGMKFSRLFSTNPRDLNEEDVQKIYRLAE